MSMIKKALSHYCCRTNSHSEINVAALSSDVYDIKCSPPRGSK